LSLFKDSLRGFMQSDPDKLVVFFERFVNPAQFHIGGAAALRIRYAVYNLFHFILFEKMNADQSVSKNTGKSLGKIMCKLIDPDYLVPLTFTVVSRH